MRLAMTVSAADASIALHMPAQAQEATLENGNGFAGQCSDQSKRVYSLAFINGAADALDLTDFDNKNFCPRRE